MEIKMGERIKDKETNTFAESATEVSQLIPRKAWDKTKTASAIGQFLQARSVPSEFP